VKVDVELLICTDEEARTRLDSAREDARRRLEAARSERDLLLYERKAKPRPRSRAKSRTDARKARSSSRSAVGDAPYFPG
jgi:hypothetical protein